MGALRTVKLVGWCDVCRAMVGMRQWRNGWKWMHATEAADDHHQAVVDGVASVRRGA